MELAGTVKARLRPLALRRWTMQPLSGMLVLRIEVAVPGGDDPQATRSVLLTLNEGQVRQLSEQLQSELGMLRKERPAGTA